ncbi:hypothetical protein chiPu_0022882, partial [Chiloscyllium punctatum]|nr:hypothetical protein [Chiloscyllium punctatum]
SSTDKLPHAGRVLQGALLSSFPNLLRDHKHHLKTLRHCCSGEELVDVLMKFQPALQGRLQAVGILQLLLDLELLVPGKQGLKPEGTGAGG